MPTMPANPRKAVSSALYKRWGVLCIMKRTVKRWRLAQPEPLRPGSVDPGARCGGVMNGRWRPRRDRVQCLFRVSG